MESTYVAYRRTMAVEHSCPEADQKMRMSVVGHILEQMNLVLLSQ